MKYTIYKITNKLDNKIYIGKHQTKNLDDNYMGSGKHLNHAKEKHGIENFVKEILFIFDTEHEMNDKEAELVNEDFCLREDTYNICPGGHGGWGYINQNGLVDHQKLSKIGNKKLKFLNENDSEFKNKKIQHAKKFLNKGGINPLAFFGKKHSVEAKKKISDKLKVAQAGSKNSQFGTMWITNGATNRKIKNVDFIPEGWQKGRKIV